MTAQIDLNELRVDRTAERPRPTVRRRPVLTRYVIPLSVLIGFAVVIGWSARDSLLPSKPVTVVPVIVARAEVQQTGTPLFQAAGWVEPRPTPVTVSALVEGVVEQLLVVQGQEVLAGQPVAKLMDADVRLALRDAEASVQLKEAEVGAAQAALTAARDQAEYPLALQVALAEAEASQAKTVTELRNLPFAIRAANSRLQLARQDREGKLAASEAVPGRSLQRAQSEFDLATAALEELHVRGSTLEAEAAAQGRKCDALRKQLELKLEENRRVAEADAALKVAHAKLRQAELVVEAAKLRLERMTVRAPMTGRVLAITTQPGRRVMGLAPASEHDAASILTLYDPQMLQVRADVRLEDVRQVQSGQPALIESAAITTPLAGEVLTITSLADIQKNTLQVKVAIRSPPALLKPEMLVQVTFLAPRKSGPKTAGSEDPLRLLVPRQLLESSEGGVRIWVADGARRVARRQAVKLGRAGTEELIEVVAGLTATDKLIAGGREGLDEGSRIKVTGDDATLGLPAHRVTTAAKSLPTPPGAVGTQPNN